MITKLRFECLTPLGLLTGASESLELAEESVDYLELLVGCRYCSQIVAAAQKT